MVDAHRSVMLVLHDVAPETWPDYQPFVAAVDALGDIPITWLVVPDFHKRNALDADARFRRVLHDRLARGDELALHGYYHCDDGPAPSTPRDYFMRRTYTCDPQHLYRLPDFSEVDAPGLVWSAKSAWRRGLSKVLSDHRQTQFREASTIRLGLHPVDMRHEFSRHYWLQTLQRLMDDGRQPMTKAAWLQTRPRD